MGRAVGFHGLRRGRRRQQMHVMTALGSKLLVIRRRQATGNEMDFAPARVQPIGERHAAHQVANAHLCRRCPPEPHGAAGFFAGLRREHGRTTATAQDREASGPVLKIRSRTLA